MNPGTRMVRQRITARAAAGERYRLDLARVPAVITAGRLLRRADTDGRRAVSQESFCDAACRDGCSVRARRCAFGV